MSYIDLIIKIKNAQAVKKKSVEVIFSKTNKKIAEILQKANFLTKVEVKGSIKKFLELTLNPQKPIRGVKFLSKPSIKRYCGYREITQVKGGEGLLVISTPLGIMTGEEAKKAKVGGQVLFEIW